MSDRDTNMTTIIIIKRINEPVVINVKEFDGPNSKLRLFLKVLLSVNLIWNTIQIIKSKYYLTFRLPRYILI